ncbi:MAG: protein kinase [Sandaracinaceae bacterium]
MSTTSINATVDLLRGELERLFDLDGLMKLSDQLLGLDPNRVGGTEGKGAFARALVEHCRADDSLLALADALILSKDGVSDKINVLFDAHPGEELKVGSEVGGFRVLKKLGEGGVGVVYLGEKKEGEDKLRAAIKVLRPAHARDRAAVMRWLTVARVTKSVDARGLAPVIDVGTLPDGRPWIATQFIEGQSVSSRIGRTGPMHYNEARPIVRGVLEALEGLHARGLAHGDVKAENVFMVRPTAADNMTNEPTGVLVDAGVDRLFGRSPVGASETGLLPVFGTAKAISPELARGGRADATSDLYAVGCLLYEMVAGRPPFTGKSGIDVVAQHLASDPDAPSAHAPRGWVAKELDAIVLRAIAKDPADRYQSAQEMRETLEQIGRRTIPPEAREQKPLDNTAFENAEKALLADPGKEDLAVALERVVEPAGAWAKAVEAFKKAAEKAEAKDAKIALHFRAARLYESDLDDAKAAEASYRAVLELDGESEIARAAIEELKRKSGDAEGLVELLLEKVEGEELAEERAAILKEIAETYEKKLKDSENAFVAWVQALAETPRDERCVEEVERLAEGNMERWNEAIAALNETLESVEDDSAKPPVYNLLGRWYADRLNRPDFAVPCFGQALTIDPANDAAMEGTIALYRRAQSWQELVTMLVQRADASSNPVRARDWRAEAAQIVHTKLGDPVNAAGLFEQILADDPAHPIASESLEHIYTERKEWRPLVKLLETKAKNERAEAKVATLCGIAEVYEDRLQDLDQAATHFESALHLDPSNVVALKGLERIYARAEKYPELLKNLEAQLTVAATPRQRIALLERMGGIQLEEFVDHEKAQVLYAQIVEIEPGHEGANGALARIYRKLQRFDDLAATLERHGLGAEKEDRKIELLLSAAKTLMVDVGAPERALTVIERVLALAPEHNDALEIASRLQAQTGDAQKALDATERLAQAENDASKKADLYVRAGRILEDSGDRDGAIARYKLALDAQPDNTNAAAALRQIYAGRGDAHGAAELLLREIGLTDGATKKAQLFAELGELRRDRLEDERGAREAFDSALELDPTCTPAARGLGDIAFAKKNWEGVVKHYEPLLARTSEMPADVARDVSVRCGDAFRRLEMYDKAQRAYLNAKAFASDDREVLERVAEVTFDMGAPDEAAELYKDVLKQFGRELVGGEKGRVLWRLGESLRKSDQLGEAKLHLTEAADLLPDDPSPLRSLKELYATQKRWEDVLKTIKRRMDVASDDERFDLLVETGDVLMAHVGDKAKASKAYVDALELKGDDRNLLTKLMAVYSENKDWSRLVEVILRIAELVNEPKQLAKYYHTAASICHLELGRLEEAADYYETALEHDATMLKSFEGLVGALNAQADYDRLADVFKGRLKRLGEGADPKDRAHLYDQLGDLYLRRLEKTSDAVDAYEEAQKLDPGNRQRAEQLAEVYSAEPKRHFAKAVKVHGDLLKLNPYRIESYQALRKLYTEAKKPDESWCACQALAVLKNAEPDEESFYKKHRGKGPAAAKSSLNDALWVKNVVHPTQDPLLTEIFAVISPAVIATRSQPLSAFKVSDGDKLDPAKAKEEMAQMLHYGAGVAGMQLPAVYRQKNDPGALTFLFASPPAIGLGQGALAGGPQKALAFVAGRHLSYLRQGHYLRMLVPTGSGLRAWLLAAIKSVVGQFPVPKNLANSVEEHIASFKTHIKGPEQERLRSHVQKLLAAAPELDLKKWVGAVDLTADRFGFVLSNDLELSSAVIKASPEESAGVPQKDRLKELQVYAVSEEYLALRQKLGIAIGS